MDRKSIFVTIVSRIADLLEDLEFLYAFRFPGCFTRTRKLTMRMIIMFLFNSTKQKMATNIDNLRDIESFEFPENVSKQAISKARHGIMPDLFRSLFDLATDIFYKNLEKREVWKGLYHIFAIDGSKIQLPNSRSNFRDFGEMFRKDNPKCRWSMALGSTIYDVCNDFIAHALLLPYTSSERAAAIRHCEALENTGILNGKCVIIFDRGYYSEDMFRYFQSKGYLCVIRMKESYNLSKRCNGDTIDTLKGDPKAGTEDIPIRVIKINLGNGTTEYLATNIFNAFTVADFKELYFMRWSLEVKYKEVKGQFCLEEFIGASSISVEQEFYITLLYSNLAALVKKQADSEIEKNANEKNKYRYQSNRSYIIGRIRPVLSHFLCRVWGMDKINELFENACHNKSQVQPDRHQPRKKPKNERTRFNNKKACFA